MIDSEYLLLIVIFGFVLYLAVERYRLRDYQVKTDDLPDGVAIRTFCRGTTHITIVSDGEGYSRPIKKSRAATCGYHEPGAPK